MRTDGNDGPMGDSDFDGLLNSEEGIAEDQLCNGSTGPDLDGNGDNDCGDPDDDGDGVPTLFELAEPAAHACPAPAEELAGILALGSIRLANMP